MFGFNDQYVSRNIAVPANRNILKTLKIGIKKINIYDMYGRKVLEQNNPASGLQKSLELGINVLSQGTYCIELIDSENKKAIKKIINL